MSWFGKSGNGDKDTTRSSTPLLVIEANHDIHRLRFGPYPERNPDWSIPT